MSNPTAEPVFYYKVFDRRYGKFFEDGSIRAANKTEARRAIMEKAHRFIPRDARNHGYVPLRDWRIVWGN